MRLHVISILLGFGGLLPVLALPIDDTISAVHIHEAKTDAAAGAAAAAVVPGVGTKAKRNLSNSCNHSSCYMVNHSRLSCSCIANYSPNGTPNFRTSTLNLDACFANRFGDLVPQDSGFFTRSCTNARVYGSSGTGGLWLEARCYNSNSQQDDWSYVSLGLAVSNTQGVLTCFGHRGT